VWFLVIPLCFINVPILPYGYKFGVSHLTAFSKANNHICAWSQKTPTLDNEFQLKDPILIFQVKAIMSADTRVYIYTKHKNPTEERMARWKVSSVRAQLMKREWNSPYVSWEEWESEEFIVIVVINNRQYKNCSFKAMFMFTSVTIWAQTRFIEATVHISTLMLAL